MAAREGVSVKRLVRAAWEGELGRRIGAVAIRDEKRKRLGAEATIVALKGRIDDLKEEIGILTQELSHLRREVARHGSE